MLSSPNLLITTMEQANTFLLGHINRYNEKFSVKPEAEIPYGRQFSKVMQK